MVSLNPVHEGLQNYISDITKPGGLSAPTSRPRFAVAPGGEIPQGRRPIPASSERPKQANVQIPYVRKASGYAGALGRKTNPVEGDIVFVNKCIAYRNHRIAPNRPSYTPSYSIEQLNGSEYMLEVRENPFDDRAEAAALRFNYELDGVVNNVDWPDPENEYKSEPLLNVAIQGPVRLDHAPERRCTLRTPAPLSTVYVGLFAVWNRPITRKPTEEEEEEGGTEVVVRKGGFSHVLVRFSSCRILNDRVHKSDVTDFFRDLISGQISKGQEVVDADKNGNAMPAGLLKAWCLGKVVDTNHSSNLLMVTVATAHIRPIFKADAKSYQKPNPEDGSEAYYCLGKKKRAGPASTWSGFAIEDRSVMAYFKSRYDWTDAASPKRKREGEDGKGGGEKRRVPETPASESKKPAGERKKKPGTTTLKKKTGTLR